VLTLLLPWRRQDGLTARDVGRDAGGDVRENASVVPAEGAIPVEADEPIPEVEAELVAEGGPEDFLRAVRRLVHGEGVDDPVDDAADAEPEPAVEEDLGDWLPGVWAPDGSSRGKRRAGRRAARSTTRRIPAQGGPGEAASRSDLAEAVSRRERRRERQREAARSIALAVPAVDEPVAVGGDGDAATGTTGAAPTLTASRRVRSRKRRVERPGRVQTGSVVADIHGVEPEEVEDVLVPSPPPAATPRGSWWARRRHRREERAFARAIARAVARGESGPGRDVPETLQQYLGRVEAARLPRRSRRSRRPAPVWLRRTTKAVLVGALIAGCVALPWAAPQVPGMFADLLPDNGTAVTRVEDPPVSPPADAFVGPVGIDQQAGPYAGVRLLSAGQPREVRVARLHVDSEVVPISGQSGSLLPPSDPQVLGWWQEGKPVGAQVGTAVITGHTVHTGGGALDNLDKLVVGDSLRVRTDQGWIGYVVQRARIYPTSELARDADRIFRLGGTGRLVLITCDDWNGTFYESNAVVFATPVADEPFDTAGTEVPDGGPTPGADSPSGNMDGPRGVAPVKPIDR
jgi:LPXTG-site transpeptidase (sortase) family protein